MTEGWRDEGGVDGGMDRSGVQGGRVNVKGWQPHQGSLIENNTAEVSIGKRDPGRIYSPLFTSQLMLQAVKTKPFLLFLAN